MVSKLRKRVVIYTVIAVALVLALLMGIVNIANFISKDKAANEILEILADNNGEFPAWGGGRDDNGGMPSGGGGPSDNGGGLPSDGGREGGEPFGGPNGGAPPWMLPGMTEETPYETRFFTVDVKADGSIKAINTGRIAAVDSSKAVEMVARAEERGKTSGYDGNYKYIVKNKEGDKTYIFLDCTRDLNSVKSFLKTSMLVSLIGLIAITLFVILLSPKMIKPIAESYAKQKEFITNAGHELKTPMAVIESCAEVIELESGESKWTSGIKEQVKKLSDLTTHMVSLAKMDEQEDLAMEDVNLSELVETALEGFCLEAEQQNRIIEKNIESDISIKGNATLLTELVSILADNALKYASADKPIKFSLTKEGKKVVLAEENYAEGLEKGNQNKLFDRFYRGDTSHNSNQPGSGIGLSMAQSIVTAHGGTITAESPDGQRLIFTAKF